MLIDLLSTDNYGKYNIKVAGLLGLEAAVYLDAVLNIYEKAVRKNKVSDYFFVLDRDYLQKRTTLAPEKQLEIESQLMNLGILTVKESCTLKIDIVFLLNLLSSDDEDIREGTQKLLSLKAKTKKKTKKEIQAELAKREINTGDAELNTILDQWVDAIIAKQSWISKITVKEGQDKLIAFASPNLSVAKDVAKIAAIGGYRDMQWAINQYKEQHPSFTQSKKELTTQTKGVTVSTERIF